MATITTTNKNVLETMAELKNVANINLGVDTIEFPDGTKEKFFFNGEEDKQAAIRFAQICYNATNDTCKAKQMMATCFALLTNGITPTETVEICGTIYYIDHEKKLLCDSCGNTIVELTEEEKAIEDNRAITIILKERAEALIIPNGYWGDEYL